MARFVSLFMVFNNAMAAESKTADLSKFHFIPLVQFLADRRKISQKHFLESQELQAVFRPEGFVAVPFASKIKKEKLEAKFQKEVEEVDLPHIQDHNPNVLMRNVKF